MLQNISEYWKLNENLIVNDFDISYIVIVFASRHLLMDTTRDSLVRDQFFPIFFCHWLAAGVFSFSVSIL